MRGVELSALSGAPRLDGIEVWAEDGTPLFIDLFEAPRQGWTRVLAGVVMGAMWGAALGLSATGGSLLWPLLLGVLPMVTLLGTDQTWLGLVERAYLTRTPYWELSKTVLGLGMLPLALLAVLRTPSLQLRKAESTPVWGGAWALVALGAGLLASRGGWEQGMLLPWVGLAVLLAPVWALRVLSLDARRWWMGELPVLVVLAVVGWPVGLPVLLAWRGLRVAGSAGFFLDHAPTGAVRVLLASGVLFVATLELGIRSTYLDTVWAGSDSPQGAAGLSDWRAAQPTWTGACGPSETAADRVVRVAWAGGSSTGGAFQFRDDPGAFFPAQVHERLCTGLAPGLRIESRNYGDGARDTFTIAHTVDQMIGAPPVDLLVLYVGVNDLLTDSGGTPRKDREALRLQADGWGFGRLAHASRLITGMAMLTRERGGAQAGDAVVPEVPLHHAEENVRAIAEAAGGKTRVLLMAELLRTAVDGSLAEYARMLSQVAEDSPHVTATDLGGLLPGEDRALLLADRNHFTRHGSARVGAVLAPVVEDLLGLSEAAGDAAAERPQ